MSNSKIGTFVAFTVSIILILVLIDSKMKTLKIRELEKEIDENDHLTTEIKRRLTELISNNKEVEQSIGNELAQIAALIEIKQDNSAVLKLAKIIENLLKELYNKDLEVKEIAKANGRRTPSFHDYIEHAKNKATISKEDYHLLSILKIIRNEEAHELDVKKEKSRVLAASIAAIGIILSLCRILKKKNLEKVVV